MGNDPFALCHSADTASPNPRLYFTGLAFWFSQRRDHDGISPPFPRPVRNGITSAGDMSNAICPGTKVSSYTYSFSKKIISFPTFFYQTCLPAGRKESRTKKAGIRGKFPLCIPFQARKTQPFALKAHGFKHCSLR